jgi:mRNA interferase RelE/StbE
VFETDEFAKRLKKFSSHDAAFLRKKLEASVYPQIKREPYFGRNVKKLRGYTPSTWRYRIGRFRMFYTVDREEQIVYVLTIHDRRDAYK